MVFPPPFCAFNFPRLPFLVFVFDPFRSRSPALLSRRTRASSSSPRRCPHRADEQTRRLHRNAHRRGYVHYSSRMGVGSHRSSCSAASFPSSSATFALSSFIHSLSSKFSLFFYSTRGVLFVSASLNNLSQFCLIVPRSWQDGRGQQRRRRRRQRGRITAFPESSRVHERSSFFFYFGVPLHSSERMNGF